jgi:hypothetical protein
MLVEDQSFMKLSHVVLAFALLVSSAAFAQVNFETRYGTLTTQENGELLLIAPMGSIQGIQVVGNMRVAFPTKLISGNLQDGAVFAKGGTFHMEVFSPVPYKFDGTFEAGGNWVLGDVDPWSYYVSFIVVSPQGIAGCGFQSNLMDTPFAGSLTVDYAVVCNTDITQPETKVAN